MDLVDGENILNADVEGKEGMVSEVVGSGNVVDNVHVSSMGRGNVSGIDINLDSEEIKVSMKDDVLIRVLDDDSSFLDVGIDRVKLPNADLDGKECMLSEVESSVNVIDGVYVSSMDRENVAGVDINLEESEEIRVSVKDDVLSQVLDDDSSILDVGMERANLPKADVGREEGMLLDVVSSENVVDVLYVSSMDRGNVADVDINLEDGQEIKVSGKDDVPNQVFDDDFRIPDVGMEQVNLEMESHVSSMRNEENPQRVSGDELNAMRVLSGGSHFDINLEDSEEIKVSVKDGVSIQVLDDDSINLDVDMEQVNLEMDSHASSLINEEFPHRVSGDQFNAKRDVSGGFRFDINSEYGEEINVSVKDNVLIQVLDGDTRILDVGMEQISLEMASRAASMRNEDIPQRVSGEELNAKRDVSGGSHFDINLEYGEEIKVSVNDDIPSQVLDDDSSILDVGMEQVNLEMYSHDSSMRNEELPQRVSGDELNAKRVVPGGSHIDINLEVVEEIKVSVKDDVPIQVLDDESSLLDVGMEQVNPEMDSRASSMTNKEFPQRVSGDELNAMRVVSSGSHFVNIEDGEEIKASVKDAVPIQVLNDDSSLLDVGMEHVSLEMDSHASSMRNEEFLQRVSGAELNAMRVVPGASHFDINLEDGEEIKVSVAVAPIKVLDDDSMVLDVGMEQVNLEMDSQASSIRNKEFPKRVSGDELNVKRVVSGESHFDSKISVFNEASSLGPSKASIRTVSSSVSRHYEVGDMVWGKVKSHPWWPGQIFNDLFASPEVLRTKRPGHFLVAFFGDSSYGWFPSEELVPFEPNFEEKSQQSNSKTFIQAVEEAVDEIQRRCSMGLSCKCRSTCNFHPTRFQGYLAVDVGEHESGGIYSVNQIEKTRDLFKPKKTVDHIKNAAQMPLGVDYHDISVIQNNATTLAYRKSVYEEFDKTYAQALGQKFIHRSPISLETTTTQAAIATRVPLSGPLVIPEAMGKKKTNPIKLNKAKEINKDKYLFKRREDPNEPKTKPNHPMESSVLPLPRIERLKVKNDNVLKRPFTEMEKKSAQTVDMKMRMKKRKMDMTSSEEMQGLATRNQNLKLPELLKSLEALAKDPFYNSNVYSPRTVKDAFLRFRSQVYQKSLVETGAKPETGMSSKQAKPAIIINRPVDQTKVGRKLEQSDPREESSSKRLKKTHNLKPGISSKPPLKSAPKPPLKSVDRPQRIRQPTALVIKFPPNVSLPSTSELKARLARFGPLDQNETRIFYKTHTCRVVFLFKSDAMAANNHLSGTSRLFGNAQVMCHVRDMSTQPPEPEPQQLKSCLKKPTSGDEASDTAKWKTKAKTQTRVKFLLGDEETSPANRKLARNGTISSPGTISSFQNGPVSQNMPVKVVDVLRLSNMDISPQMLGLLARCSDVVTRIHHFFGYIPYHSL